MPAPGTRRDFLHRCLLAGAALAQGQKLERRGPPKKVLIVGAGLAGLVAAYELVEGGHEATILEAQLRPGGRVLTLRESFSDGLFAEAGAARIPDTHQLTLDYARRFELPLAPFYPAQFASLSSVRGQRVQSRPGEKVRWPLDLTPEEQGLGVPGLRQKYIFPVLKEIGDPRLPGWPPASLEKYNRVTFYDFLRQRGASPDAQALLTLGLGMDTVSALYLLRDMAFDQGSRQFFKIQDGNDRLPRAFASRLAGRIRYGTPVTRIERDERGVRAVFLQAGAPETIAGDYLICAVPFSVFRRIEVAPPFSPEKRRAIDELPYNSIARIFLQTRNRFWTRQGLSGYGLTDHPMEIWAPAFDQPGERGILLCYIRGALARGVTAMAEPERIRYGLAELERLFPGLRENLEGGASKCWDQDEWSRGAAAEFHSGQMTALLPHVSRPEGRVFFAGEHASARPGWMQGALESGVAAAREINQAG